MCVFGLKKRHFLAKIDKEGPKCTEGMNVVNRASTFIYAAFSDMNDNTISNAYHSLYIIQLCFLIQILSLNHIWGDNFAPPKFQLLKCQPRFEKSTPIPIPSQRIFIQNTIHPIVVLLRQAVHIFCHQTCLFCFEFHLLHH